MVAVVSSNPTGGNFFYFLKPSMSILYRNVRFVLKMKNPRVHNFDIQLSIFISMRGLEEITKNSN